MGWFDQRQSQEEQERQHAEYLQDLARRRQEERDRFQRGEDFKRWQYEQEHGAPANTPKPPRKRGR